MRDFFRGWRRKAGCVTLVMAVMVIGLWLRSHFKTDAVYSFGARANVLSKSSFLAFVWHAPGNGDERLVEWQSWDEVSPDPFDGENLEWRVETAGVQAGEYRVNNIPVTIVAMPHQWIGLPLTLLSAYLILWKPRPKTKGEPNA